MRLLISLLISIILSGCKTDELKLVTTNIEYRKVQIICPDAPKSKPVAWQDITWIVATSDKDELKVMGLSPDDYEKLAKNTSDLIRYIKDSKVIISYYESCISDFNKNEVIENG